MATQTKAQESMETLKNVNKHLSEVFKQIAAKDIALSSVANDLRRAASKVGDIQIEVWDVNQYKTSAFKNHLIKLADTLDGAKS